MSALPFDNDYAFEQQDPSAGIAEELAKRAPKSMPFAIPGKPPNFWDRAQTNTASGPVNPSTGRPYGDPNSSTLNPVDYGNVPGAGDNPYPAEPALPPSAYFPPGGGPGDSGTGSPTDGIARPQVQDPYGRSPGHPEYGVPPVGHPDRAAYDAPGGKGGAPVAPANAGTVSPWSKGGGWDQLATDPKSFEYGLQQAFAAGKQGEDAIAWMDQNGWKGAQNPAGGGIQYYPDRNQFGLPNSYVAPGPNGTMDLIARSGGGEQTSPLGPAVTKGAGGALDAGAITNTSAAGTAAAAMSDDPSRGDALYQELLARSKQGLNVDPNDPVMRQQTDAYAATQQRQAKNFLAGKAEQLGNSANLDAESRHASESIGENVSGFQGELMQRELQSKRDEIQNALTSMQAYLTDQQKMDLQAQLAQMDNALQYARLDEQRSQFGQDFGQRRYEFDVNTGERRDDRGQRAYEFDTDQYNSLYR